MSLRDGGGRTVNGHGSPGRRRSYESARHFSRELTGATHEWMPSGKYGKVSVFFDE
jgi:hypothetical protein